MKGSCWSSILEVFEMSANGAPLKLGKDMVLAEKIKNLIVDKNYRPDAIITNCLLKPHPEPEKRMIDEHYQQSCASKRSTCALGACIRRQKNQFLRVFSRKVLQNLFFMKRRVVHDDNMLLWQIR